MKKRNHCKLNCLMFLIILIFIQIPLQFSNAQYLTSKLTENEVRAVIPVLKAEIAAYSQFEEAQKIDYLARKKLFEEIKSGKVDPLEWLKQNSKFVIVPPDVIYEKDISRALSIKDWDSIADTDSLSRINVVPIAIFTFGKELPAINKHLLGKTVTSESYNAFIQNPWNGEDPSFQEIWKIHEKMTSFYRQKGFSVGYSMDGFSLIFQPRDTDDEIVGNVNPILFEIYDPSYPDLVKISRSHPMGPSIAIWATDKLMEKFYKPIDIKLGSENSEVNVLLQKSGITKERYGEIKGALLIAKEGSKNPDEEEPKPLDITPTTPEEKQAILEYEKTRQMMIEEIRVKKNNIQLYNKYKNELEPVLEVLGQYMGGKY